MVVVVVVVVAVGGRVAAEGALAVLIGSHGAGRLVRQQGKQQNWKQPRWNPRTPADTRPYFPVPPAARQKCSMFHAAFVYPSESEAKFTAEPVEIIVVCLMLHTTALPRRHMAIPTTGMRPDV